MKKPRTSGAFSFIKGFLSLVVLDDVINEEKQVLLSGFIQFFNVLDTF